MLGVSGGSLNSERTHLPQDLANGSNHQLIVTKYKGYKAEYGCVDYTDSVEYRIETKLAISTGRRV